METLACYPFYLMDTLVELKLQVRDDTGVSFVSYSDFIDNNSIISEDILSPNLATHFENRIIAFIQNFKMLQTLIVRVGGKGGLMKSFDLLNILSTLNKPIQKLSFSAIHFPVTDYLALLPYLPELQSLRLSVYKTVSDELEEADELGYLDTFWIQLHQNSIPLSQLFVIFPSYPFLSYILSLKNITHLAFYTVNSKECADFFFKSCLPHITSSIVSLEIFGSDDIQDKYWHLSLKVCDQILLCQKLSKLGIPAIATTTSVNPIPVESPVKVWVFSCIILSFTNILVL